MPPAVTTTSGAALGPSNLDTCLTWGAAPAPSDADPANSGVDDVSAVGPGAPPTAKRTFNYAAAAAAGTSHAKHLSSQTMTAPSARPIASTSSAAVNAASSTGSPMSGGGANDDEGSTAGVDATDLSAEGKKRRNRGGRKHRARMEAIRAAADASAPGEEHDSAEPLADAVAESSLDATSSPVPSSGIPPNAWAARAAAKEKKEADEAAIATAAATPAVSSTSVAEPTSLSSSSGLAAAQATASSAAIAAEQQKTDSLSLQFGSFGLGGVDWSTSDQATTGGKSIVSVAPVVVSQSGADISVGSGPVPPATLPLSTAAASSSPSVHGAGMGSGATVAISSIAPSSDNGINMSMGMPGMLPPLGGPGGIPPVMGGLGGFAPGSYGGHNPYNMMPLPYSGLPGADMKGMPFYDPSILQGGLPGTPGKFSMPGGMQDMTGLLPGGAQPKLPGMEMDKNGHPNSGPPQIGGIQDMYMMGYPHQNVGYPPLYGFPPNPYSGAMPPGPGGVPPPPGGNNMYSYSGYAPSQNAVGGGAVGVPGAPGGVGAAVGVGSKFGGSNPTQGVGRGGFGFDDSSGVLGGSGNRNNGGLGDSIYMQMPQYLGNQMPHQQDGGMGPHQQSQQQKQGADVSGNTGNVGGSFKNRNGSSVNGQSTNGASGIPNNMLYPNDYAMMNMGISGAGDGAGVGGGVGGWNSDVGRAGGGGNRDVTGTNGAMPSATNNAYNQTPGGFWPQGAQQYGNNGY
jgi:hypothetical protein